MSSTDWARIQAVLFDWDGTLVDSYHASARAFVEMFSALGIPWGVKELESHYSPDWYRVYRAAGLPRARWVEAGRLWRSAYRRQRPTLRPGARRVLSLLARRYVLALVTSGDRDRVREEVQRFRLADIFAACVCSEDAERRKPHPAPLRLAMRRLRLPAEACLYVGDAPEDIAMARGAGVRVIGVLGPFPTERRLRAARPDALLDSINELPALLRAKGRLLP